MHREQGQSCASLRGVVRLGQLGGCVMARRVYNIIFVPDDELLMVPVLKTHESIHMRGRHTYTLT